MKSTILKDTFGSEKRFVTWKLETRKDKTTKLPYSVNGKLASSTDPKSWSTYDEVKERFENIGIVFTPEKDLLGIDIDHCLKGTNINHDEKEKIAELLIEADTYAEISPSGEGLHLFLKLSDPLTLEGNKKLPFELYTSGRYFTITNNPYKEEKPVRTVSSEEAKKILSIIGYPWKKEKKVRALLPSTDSNLPDQALLEKMFRSKNGLEIQKLYEGDTSAHKNDESAADMSLCSHLAFWTKKDASQMERMWLASPLGQRKKTIERKDYRDRTISNAIASCKETYTESTYNKNASDDELDLLYTTSREKEKIYTQNTENMCRILRKHENFKGRLRYDTFKNILEIDVSGEPHQSSLGMKWRMIEDNDAVTYQTKIQVLFPCFGKVGKDMVFDAMIKVSKENRIDSAADYFKSLVWDGEARLDEWLTLTYGTPSDAYHKAVASNWLKGAVKRAIDPGCKFDYVLVLEGPQGSKKSTSLYILGGAWHVETTMSTDNKDFFMQLQGKLFVEFSEGETMSRTEVKKMKAIITTQVDRYRPSYGRFTEDFPRRCVFAMTTNQEQYLKDETGNRRWLPVSVVKEEADIAWLEENREQLFAEAYHRVTKLQETIYEFPKEATLAAQNQRQIVDENADLVGDWYYNKLTQPDRDKGITVHEVFQKCLNGGFNSRPLDKYSEMKITNILKNSLRLVKRREMQEGFRAWRWFNPNAPLDAEVNREMTVDEIMETF